MKLSEIGERNAIKEIKSLLTTDSSKIIVGPGKDDCAVIEIGEGQSKKSLLFSSDMLTRSRHLPKEMKYRDIGWSAVAVNLSDIASMGGIPRYLTTSIGTPDIEKKELKEIIKGMKNCSRQNNSFIVGGDLCKHQEIVIDCSILGETPENILLRSGAGLNEYLCITGEVGAAGLATKSITEKISLENQVKKKAFNRMYKPKPRIKEGQKISSSGATAAIDVSDGLLISAIQLSRASGVGIKITPEKIPIDKEIADAAEKTNIPLENLIDIGGDYEILFTTKNPKKIPKNSTIIGKTIEEKTIRYGDNKIDPKGYDHFKN